jgi:glutathione peroxidase
MKSLAILIAAATVSALAAPAPAAAATPAPAAAATPAASCPVLLQHTFPRLQDEKPQPLCQYAGRVLLVVNTASYCGYTPQYQGLEDLYGRYRDRGLVVLGFPSNDFNQEKSSNKEIADFCENTFGVKFPMFGKTSVAGPDANPLFRQLAAQTGKAPSWNFHKYLIGRDGKVVAQFASHTTPSDAQLLKLLEQQLATK